MSKHTLQQMKERLAQELGRPEHQVIRFAYVQDGEWAEQAFLPACPRLECFSVTKSFTATGIGLAEAEGLLSLDDPLPRFFAAEWPAGADPRLERVTVRHLLRQRPTDSPLCTRLPSVRSSRLTLDSTRISVISISQPSILRRSVIPMRLRMYAMLRSAICSCVLQTERSPMLRRLFLRPSKTLPL